MSFHTSVMDIMCTFQGLYEIINDRKHKNIILIPLSMFGDQDLLFSKAAQSKEQHWKLSAHL